MPLLSALRRRTNFLPPALLLLFFLNGFLEAFPLTAFGQWLKDDIAMGPITQSTFYATVFVPWSLKPLYGYVSERFPLLGRRRRPYVVLASAASALTYLAAAFAVRSVAGAFAVTIARTAANACCELMLGLLLVDCAARDMRNAGAVQAAATAARALSSVAAFLVGLPMYPCRGRDTGLRPTTIIAINALFPALAALAAAFFLPDPKVKTTGRRRRGGGGGGGGGGGDGDGEGDDGIGGGGGGADTDTAPLLPAETHPVPAEPRSVLRSPTSDPASAPAEKAWPRLGSVQVTHALRRSRPDFPVNGLLLPAVLLLLTWAALRDVMSLRAWLIMLGCVLCVELAVGGVLLRHALRHKRPEDTWCSVLTRIAAVWPAVVLFLLNAMPTADTQVGECAWWLCFCAAFLVPAPLPTLCLQLLSHHHPLPPQISYYYYDIFENDTCKLQWINLTASLSKLGASVLFFLCLNNRRGRRLYNVIVVGTLLKAGLTMLYYPLVAGDISQQPGSVLPYALMVTVVAGMAGQVAFIAGLVLATQACPIDDSTGLMYALYVSFLDMGDSVGGWITAPIAGSLNISASSLSNLKALVSVDAGTSALSLLITPVLYITNVGAQAPARQVDPRREDVEEGEDESGALGEEERVALLPAAGRA